MGALLSEVAEPGGLSKRFWRSAGFWTSGKSTFGGWPRAGDAAKALSTVLRESGRGRKHFYRVFWSKKCSKSAASLCS